MWIETEDRFKAFFSSIEAPLLVDVANLSLSLDLENKPAPLPKEWLGEFAIAHGRDVNAQGTGLYIHRVPPTSLIASAPRGRVFHTWLLGADPGQLSKLLNGGMALSELDSNASYVSRNTMRAHPFGMGAIAKESENFQARIILHLHFKLASMAGQDSKTYERPFTPKPAQPMTLKPVPAIKPIDASHQVIDWESGSLTTIHEAVRRLNQECGLYFTLDPKIWDAPIFLKGKWDSSDLAEAILTIADTPRGTFRRGDDLTALSDAYEGLLDKAGNEFGIPDEIFRAAKDGHSLPFEVVLKYFPEAFSHMKGENGYPFKMSEPVSFDMSLAFNIAGPGTLTIELGGGSAMTANGASLGAQRPKTSRG